MMKNNAVARAAEMRVLASLANDALAGECSDYTQAHYDAAKRATALIGQQNSGFWLHFTQKELDLIVHALANVAGDDVITQLGLRKREQRMLAYSINRIADAAGSPRPRHPTT